MIKEPQIAAGEVIIRTALISVQGYKPKILGFTQFHRNGESISEMVGTWLAVSLIRSFGDVIQLEF